MSELLLIRHAKSDWHSGAQSDWERPLKLRGLHDAPRVAEELAARTLLPDLVLSSDAVRAAQTAQCMIERWSPRPELRRCRELYQASSWGVLSAISEQGAAALRVAVVGHNPTLEETLRWLIGREERLTTCNVAVLRSTFAWKDIADSAGAWRLAALIRPKELRKNAD